MNAFQAMVLGLVQGLTEFIPVSSSGHLVLAHHALGVFDTGLPFDVALHAGTLLALLVFFYKDLWELLLGLFGKNDKQKLAWLLIMATVPAVIAGVLLESAAESKFRSVRLVSINLFVVAFIMLWAERYAAKRSRKASINNLSQTQVLTMGVAQAAAVVPGVSRSGITITAGLFSGVDRIAATRFSFLLAIPITAGAILKVLVIDHGLAQAHQTNIIAIGVVTAFLSGLWAIKFLLNYLSKHSLAAFAYYRIAIAVIAISLVTFK
ncbi:MAG TPA: undecaprenyl-diphosphatase UppP [Candidatus Saccharimonadales bacterium]|nr:undecaprenyl-diphosphatase UppP [Candidatus Saccharimonadales bacterium]